MATLHTRFQEIHREVAAVLKLSRSSPSKPDKSASVRERWQGAAKTHTPIALFPRFCVFSAHWKIVWGCVCVGGGGCL